MVEPKVRLQETIQVERPGARGALKSAERPEWCRKVTGGHGWAPAFAGKEGPWQVHAADDQGGRSV